MESVAKIPRSVIVGIVLAIVLDTVIQILWKLAVAGVPENASLQATALAALVNPYFYMAMTAFAAQLFNWLRVLAEADLSFAQPFTALSYITVLAISSFGLHEQLTPSRVAGVLFIFLGVYLISRTSHSTKAQSEGG
ncbi:MAG: EamA family transporter [Cyanobacteria bacterium REEB67]|nr:EamA family transporter [Cyanobacteria bacterium REEB67]